MDKYKFINGKFERAGLNNLKTLAEKVETILGNIPKTRDDDHLLIGYVYHHYYEIDKKDTFGDTIKRIMAGELPGFESIIRCRRKIQETKYQGTRKEERAEIETIVKEQIRGWDGWSVS